MKRFLVIVCLLTGCAEDSSIPDVNPPKFFLGDTVAPTTSETIGIVIERDKYYNTALRKYYWKYKVLFQDANLDYTENQLRFVEHFDWTKTEPLPTKPETKGEIESGGVF